MFAVTAGTVVNGFAKVSVSVSDACAGDHEMDRDPPWTNGADPARARGTHPFPAFRSKTPKRSEVSAVSNPGGGHRRLSPRGVGLVVMALVCLMRAWAPEQLVIIEQLIPLPVSASMWAAAGVTSASAVVARRVLPYAIAAFTGLHLLWALGFIASWYLLDSPRAWVPAISYAALAALGTVTARMIDPPDVVIIGESD